MSGDTIAIFRNGAGCTIRFCIDGKWWPTIDQYGKVAVWPSSEQACGYLRQAYDRYRRDYGESLPWDMSAIPVRDIGD